MSNDSSPKRLVENIGRDTFEEWERERRYTRNIRQGKPWRNSGESRDEPRKLSPSQLTQCHRKIRYRDANAPEEQSKNRGTLWFGQKFEEEVILPYLQSYVVGSEEYVRNSMWIQLTVETDRGDIEIRGVTDPVVVDSESQPILLTEVKTKRKIDDLEEPNRHHRAQIHAYMLGLSEEYDSNVTDAVIIYGSRRNFTVESFHVEFDPDFWRETVVRWSEKQVQHRLKDTLPAGRPEYDWECSVCTFQSRCGRATPDYGETNPEGLLPLFKYPRQQLVKYLEAHEERGAKLTPSLAHFYPSLTENYEVYDWECPVCQTEFRWDRIDWRKDMAKPPVCPECASADGRPIPLTGPPAEEQLEKV